jgi:hypothetical protein
MSRRKAGVARFILCFAIGLIEREISSNLNVKCMYASYSNKPG